MRLRSKVTIFGGIVFGGVLVISGYLDVRRAVQRYANDLRDDQGALAFVLQTSAAALWTDASWQAAVELLAQAEDQRNQTTIRWVALEPDSDRAHPPRVASERVKDLLNGRTVGHLLETINGEDMLITYALVPASKDHAIAIEISRSMTRHASYARDVIRAEITSGVALLFAYALLAGVTGSWLANRSARAQATGPAQLAEVPSPAALPAGPAMAQQLTAGGSGTTSEGSDLEQRLQQINRMASVGTLAAGVIHDIGTPLNVISGRAMMISSADATAQEITDNARTIAEQTQRIAAQIRQLLTFSRGISAPATSVDLLELVRQDVALAAPVARTKKVKLHIDEASAPAVVQGDRNELRQVVSNVLLNAIQAMPQGGGVTIATGQAAGLDGGDAQVFVRIADAGVGIAPEDLERIFEPFFTTKPEREGTGLGLCVCRRIVRAHGGWIEVDSVVDEGSRFTLYFPRSEE